MHDAILVGIGTVEADDPRLTVRHVDGEDPVPVVLDTHLRFPDSARLLRRPGPAPVIATGPSPDADRRERLERQGACVVPFPLDSGGQVDIKTVLKILQGRGLGSLMVEGGAKVITSFLHTRMVDYLVLTITNRLVGGIRGVRRLCAIDGSSPERQSNAGFPRLKHMYNRWYGDDLVIQGEPVWEVGDAA
jgi:3,4-dihydroxy 2-butanone 4-phosphate synthase/GTP cyclohydrolase II